MLETFRDKIPLTVEWIEKIRKITVEARPRRGWCCAVCDKRVGRKFLAPHQSKDCFAGFEDRGNYLARTYQEDDYRCPICSHTTGVMFHRCPKGPQWIECEECARNGIRGRRDHRPITGFCQGLRNYRYKYGSVPSLATLLDEERNISIDFPPHWVQWNVARNVSRNEWNQWRKEFENRVPKVERHRLEWEKYETH